MTKSKTAAKSKTTTKTRKIAAAAAPAENKKDKVLALLRRAGGATLADITGATGWLPHTARAMLTGLRKKGIGIEKTKADGVTRYAVGAEPAA